MAGLQPAADLEEWGARLNHMGVLQAPAMPKPYSPEPQWIGEPKTAEDGWQEYDGFVIGEGESAISLVLNGTSPEWGERASACSPHI